MNKNIQTIVELFEMAAAKYPNNAYLWEKKNGVYQPSSYADVHQSVIRFAAGLMSLGIRRDDRIALLSEGRNQWLITELGALYAGAVNVPLSIKLDAETELKFRIKHSGCRMVAVSAQQAPKIEQIRKQLHNLEKVIYLDIKDNPEKNDLFYYDIIARGKAWLKSHAAEVEERWRSVKPDDLANISYTSGTTADPKGIMLSHRNYTANVLQAHSLIHITSKMRTLAFLPWDHAFAHTACLYCFMYKGASVAAPEIGNSPMETLRNIPKNIKEIKPDLLMSVPAIAKNFRKNIEAGIRQKGDKVWKLFQKAMKLAYDYNGIGWDRGKGSKIFKKPLLWLYDMLLFRKIRANFGGNLKFFIGGGALLDTELQRFFYAIGIPMCQGYGLSEASPVISSNSLNAIKFGSSGRLVKNMELKILDSDGNQLPVGEKGEIVIKGPNVMVGYWRNPEASIETVVDGWLHTGDMGYMDSDGFLHVLGRFKSLLIADDGEKFSPEGIEEAIVDQSQLIDQCMLYNNQKPFTVALLVPNMAALNRELAAKNLSMKTDSGCKAALELLQLEIDKYKRGGLFANQFPERWLPATMAILPEPFSEQNGLLNSTMKMVRGKITDRYTKELAFLYTPDAKKITNELNIKNLYDWNNRVKS
ncbi:MAG: AMP-binding protein [Bacteroidales bacterium]|jgi:long-chain acyl-CoA synthetase|nr:AMP-binding protein [Bacteroidales bacterium]